MTGARIADEGTPGPGSLDGQVALVTGGSRGIGKAIAARFVADGASVMIVSRKADACEAAAAEIGPAASWMAGNVSRPDDAERIIGATIDQLGRIDILVNNAATNPYAGPVIDTDLPRWNKTIETNLTAPLVWTQHAWRSWMSEHGGNVINISSVGAFLTSPDIGSYDVTKDALLHLTRQLAAELAPGVRVNAIAPGLIKTDFARILWEGERGDSVAANYPLKRLGEPEDIAAAASYLASADASFMTGQCLILDGGGLIGFHGIV